ncbi:MAG: uroporphyrinogen-III C-methyltransferase [Lachnospiraceae bacterium]|nr:uroporphyrinogen-III C-methyltransferase [Lachnospiraceae bacterium]
MEEKNTGKVWLVGAGPSDPGLFTLKGKQVLEEAEVVVYDALVGQAILNMIPDTAEAVNVGKRSSNHIMVQEKINELLAQKAKEGKRVVRLKGGDPFLFGRGGEEIELLVKEHVPYEVVPGITSAISVPAYQGIPVTHRDFCSSVHIITGHKRAGKSYDIDFEALVRTKGTLVFLMGVSSLGDICRGLLEAGMDAEKPAALLIRGTTASQERIVATVGTLEEEVKRRGAKTPAIIVVGDVCALAEDFSWYDKLPLGGVRVLLTRPKELISETARKLRALGAEVLELPSIRTVKIENNEKLHRALAELERYDWLVFTSPTGVRIFFEELSSQKMDVRKLGHVKIAAIGGGTKKELAKHGLYADLLPEIFDGEHLGKALAENCRAGERVLIPRAAAGNQELVDALQGICSVDDIPTYDTVYESGRLIDERAELENGTIDYVVFTSASTVRGFAAAVGEIDYTKVKAICIGRQTREAADKMGMQTWMSQKASIDSLVDRLAEVHKGEQEWSRPD